MAELSARVSALMRQLSPKLPASNLADSGTYSDVIDLSIAENDLLRDEMVEIVQAAVSRLSSNIVSL